MARSITFAACIALSACATIDHSSSSSQSLNKVLAVGPGDIVLRVERERNLENAFGKADIFGRKTKEGFTELRFAGVEANGEIVLYRKDVTIVTNETTMSRTPLTTTTGTTRSSLSGSSSTYGGSTQFQGSGTSSFTSTTLSPVSDFHIVVPSDTVPVRLSPNEKRIPVAGYLVEIISATRNALEYKLSKPE